MLPSACGLGQHFQDLGHSFSLYGPPSRQITYIYFFQMTRYHPCGTLYWDKVSYLYACAADQFYIRLHTLVWTREIFPVKQMTHVAISKTYTSMKARDVKSEKQMKSSFFQGNLSIKKGEVSYFIPLLICCVKVTKFFLQGNTNNFQGEGGEQTFHMASVGMLHRTQTKCF